MVGVSDFNGDGETDYLWRKASTGTTAIWEMRNGSISQGYYLPTRDSSWSVNLATDLNNDGKGDILWQNNLGQNLVWYMDGGTVLGSDSLLTVGDRNWRMEAAGDFNYDGKTDLLWRNYASGENAAWLMNGSQLTGTMSFLTINDRSWTIEGAGDFNDDGKVDLLWHHTSGINATWNLNGTAIASSTTLTPVSDPTWQIMGVGRRFETPPAADLPGSITNLALNLGDITGLTSGGSVRVGGSVSSSDPTDYYRFTLTSATIVDMVLDSAIDSVQLVTPNATVIQQGGASSQTLQAGTHYLQVNPSAPGKANYFLNLTARNPNTSSGSTFNIQFDYRFDSSNWYTTAKRAALDAAADFWERIILDEFADTPIGTGVPFVKNPTTDQNIGVNNIFTTDVAIDDLLVFVGSLDIPGTTLAYAGPSGFYDNDTRYIGDDFEPRIGSLTFDSATNWFIDSTPATRNDIPASQFDFIGTAIHELGHILGFSRGLYAFDRYVLNNTFTGPNARRVNGGQAVPLSSDSHIQENYTYSNYGESSLDPTTMAGVRQLPTLLDMAILDDIGYTINYAFASTN
jgi:FG-GAP-like repeat